MKKKSPPQYFRVSLYFDKAKDLAKVSRAAKKAGRSRNNWIILASLRAAEQELGEKHLPVLNNEKTA